MQRRLKNLSRLYDPAGLCYGLAEALLQQGRQCDHTFTIIREQMAEYAPDVDVEAVIRELEALGYHCDCETAYNLCADLGV